MTTPSSPPTLPVPADLTARLFGLPVLVEEVSIEALSLATASGWVRRTSVACLSGAGVTGRGEDVTYAGPDHDDLQAGRVELAALHGRRDLGDLLELLGGLDLFLAEPGEPKARKYRRWAFESAALDLALRQAGTDLAAVLGRDPAALHFGVSLSLDGQDFGRLEEVLAVAPASRFKLDFAAGWDARTLERLAALDAVDVVDFKGHYHGDFRGPDPDAAAYAEVARALPGAWLEDPWLGAGMGGPWAGDTWEALAPFADRLTWDAPFGSLADLVALPVKPRAVNLKPSRFGSLAELLAILDHCARAGISCYSGGQFELGVGRLQVQLLAALFHPGGANDCAPSAYNAERLAAGLPTSPLLVERSAFGVAPA
ncbi:MAG: hypothetical protein P1V81_05540 [Planctomycetota bacterium]|nr:hypothetical protein [Planctomycetota bacterium]